MDTRTVIRVSRGTIKKRREQRKATDIKASSYLQAIRLDRPTYINQNRGILL